MSLLPLTKNINEGGARPPSNSPGWQKEKFCCLIFKKIIQCCFEVFKNLLVDSKRSRKRYFHCLSADEDSLLILGFLLNEAIFH